MKRQYIKPETSVVTLSQHVPLLAGSVGDDRVIINIHDDSIISGDDLGGGWNWGTDGIGSEMPDR